MLTNRILGRCMVVVTKDRWDAFQYPGDTVQKGTAAITVLDRIGGINNSVAPGIYEFTIRRYRIFKVKAELLPMKMK